MSTTRLESPCTEPATPASTISDRVSVITVAPTVVATARFPERPASRTIG